MRRRRLLRPVRPGIPEWNLRWRVTTDSDGHFAIHTIRPAAYQIPTDEATGAIIRAANWHAWRPAHVHLKVSAPASQLITTQLYFPGDPHNDDDIAAAVKPELMLDPRPAAPASTWSTTSCWTRPDHAVRREDGCRPAGRYGPGRARRDALPGEGLQPGPGTGRTVAHPSRIVGRYLNLSIFDVADNDELHTILGNLPLIPCMTITVTPLATHPSDLSAG